MTKMLYGQKVRQEIIKDIEINLEKYCPNTLHKISNLIAYDYNMSPRKIRDEYLSIFISKGILESQDNYIYTCKRSVKK